MPPQKARPKASLPSPKRPEKVAKAPFSVPEVDVILRSSDEKHYYVIKKKPYSCLADLRRQVQNPPALRRIAKILNWLIWLMRT
jgi:hypothetical protein